MLGINRPDMPVEGISSSQVHSNVPNQNLDEEGFINRIEEISKSESSSFEPPEGKKPKRKRIDLSLPRVENKRIAVRIDETDLIRNGELLVLNSLPGTGKTNVTEVVAVAYLVQKLNLIDVDTLGISVDVDTSKPVLIIDTERTYDDCRDTSDRISRRTGIPQHELTQYIHFYSFAEIDSSEACKEEFSDIIEEQEFSLIIVDGILDFASSINDEKDSSNTVRFFRSKAVQHDAPVIVTIHPNKGTESIAGHLGAFLYRWSRAVLLIRKDENTGFREITSQFVNGKLSHSSKEVSWFFDWSTNDGMFMSAEVDRAALEATNKRKKKDHVKMISGCFDKNNTARNYSDLCDSIMSHAGVKVDRAKQIIRQLSNKGVLVKNESTGCYKIHQDYISEE